MIQVVRRALDIIELVAGDAEKTWPLSAIADPLKMNHGTCANILKTLVDRNYIEKLPAKKGYRLGRMAYKLAAQKDYKNDLVAIARESMEKLTKKFNENTLLSVLHENKRVAILRINSQHELQIITPTEKTAYDSSTGRLLVAMLPDAELEKFITKYGLPKIKGANREVNKAAFMLEVNKIRKNKYATYLPDDHILGMAFPIYQRDRVIASLSIYVPDFRSSATVREKMMKDLSLAAQKISAGINSLSL